MKGKLIKGKKQYSLLVDKKNIGNFDVIETSLGFIIADEFGIDILKLSKQNCDEIFGIVDIDTMMCNIESNCNKTKEGFVLGFKMAIELNKDKLFNQYDVLDVVNHVLHEMVLFEGFDKQYLFPESVYHEVTKKCSEIKNKPTEIEVEVVMDKIPADLAPGGWDVFPKLDKDNCLILKRVE